jgi:hypothetical protein
MPRIGVGVGLDRVHFGGSFAGSYSSRVIADGGTIEALTCVSAASLLLQSASLLLIPSGYKASVAYAVLPSNGNGDLTWFRNSVANRTQSNGNIGSVAANVPRLDYTYGSCPALFLEPQRTNLVFPSATASTQTRTVTAVAHTLSFFGTGSVTLSGVATGTLNGTGANNRVTLTFTPTAGSLTLTVSGSVTNWQLEVGSYATTLIDTTSATATRLGDYFRRSNIRTNGLISASGGTWYVELRGNVSLIAESATSGFWLGTNLFTDNSNGTLYFRQGGGSQRTGIWKYEGGSQTSIYATTSENVKLAIKWNGTSADVFANGTKVVSATSFTATNMEFLAIASMGIGRTFFIQAMALFATPLSDTNCQTLTT